jgi:hypothetical protein
MENLLTEKMIRDLGPGINPHSHASFPA